MSEQNNEFYIGWQAEAPPHVARTIRTFVWALVLFVPVVALLIVNFQRGFSNGTFEYGKTSELTGILSVDPVPFLTIQNGTDAAGRPVSQKILLVGPGKFGFTQGEGGRLADPDLTGKPVQVTGFLIYHDGKTAMEVSDIQPSPQLQTSNSELQTSNYQTSNSKLGTVSLLGEIADPKCLLGVMKPGQGKPHRDCAARCMAGGIPPLLKVANSDGETEYYLVVGPKGEALNAALLPYAADGVRICGQLKQEDDWLVLYANPASLQRVNKFALNPGPLCQ